MVEKIYYNKSLKPRAQELRRESTPQENHLWYDYLRNYPKQFRRQKQFARYIVDFYCSSARLVIELDGNQHNESEAMEHDHARTVYLLRFGIMRSTMNFNACVPELTRQFGIIQIRM